MTAFAGALRVMGVLEGHDTLHLPKDAAIQDLLRNDREGLLANQPTLAAIIAEQQPSLQVISILNLDLKNKSYRIQRLSSRVHNELKVLQEPWKVLWYLFVRPPADAPSAGDDTRPDGNGVPSDDGEIAETSSPVPVSTVEQEQLVEETDEVIAANLTFGGFQRTKQEFQDFLRREQERLNNVFTLESLEHVLSQSKSMPAILSQYFLPMLYGLLGSLTWILRALSKEIRDVTFTRGSATTLPA